MKPLSVKLASALLVALGAASLGAHAGGNVVVVNETDQGIHPFFRYNCWGTGITPGTTGWVFFGGIGPRGQFGWNFADPSLTNPACRNPKLEFTYTVDPDVSTPPEHPAIHAKFRFSPLENVYMQSGERIEAINLNDDDHDDHDDD
ncbi:MAG TPA: hypothetical protein VLY46_09330 [Usitatibacter sp.]|nr:hypothetical protein [Usitatibacter sp.]